MTAAAPWGGARGCTELKDTDLTTKSCRAVKCCLSAASSVRTCSIGTVAGGGGEVGEILAGLPGAAAGELGEVGGVAVLPGPVAEVEVLPAV